MRIEFDFLPPNCNHGYLRPSGGGKWFMAKEAKEFKEQIGWLVKKFTPFTEDVVVDVQFVFADKRKRDAQNLEKLLWDSLEGYCYTNDRQIADRRVRRTYGAAAKTIIEVKELK